MSVVLESRILRDFLHHLVDGLIDNLEKRATSRVAVDPRAGPIKHVSAVDLRELDRRSGELEKPRIMPEEPTGKPSHVKAAPPPPRKFPDVTVACRSSCGRLEIAVSLSTQVAKRLGLKPHGKADTVLRDGKLRVRASKVGRTLFPGGTTGRLWFATVAEVFGVTEKHAAESCTFHYDLQDVLLVEPPGWLKGASVRPPSTKPASQKPKDGPPVSCKKMAGTNPVIKCAACKTAPASLQCNLCPTLLCDGCWPDHVRVHWHSKDQAKAAVAVRDARQAMRSQA